MMDLKKKELGLLSTKPFSILLFYAEGCKHCEAIKPIFEEYSKEFPEIGFFTTSLSENFKYYSKFAEQTPDVKFNEDGTSTPILNEDGSPKMVTAIIAPYYYVHHTAAVDPENEYGFIGGWEGALEKDLITVITMIKNFENEKS